MPLPTFLRALLMGSAERESQVSFIERCVDGLALAIETEQDPQRRFFLANNLQRHRRQLAGIRARSNRHALLPFGMNAQVIGDVTDMHRTLGRANLTIQDLERLLGEVHEDWTRTSLHHELATRNSASLELVRMPSSAVQLPQAFPNQAGPQRYSMSIPGPDITNWGAETLHTLFDQESSAIPAFGVRHDSLRAIVVSELPGQPRLNPQQLSQELVVNPIYDPDVQRYMRRPSASTTSTRAVSGSSSAPSASTGLQTSVFSNSSQGSGVGAAGGHISVGSAQSTSDASSIRYWQD